MATTTPPPKAPEPPPKAPVVYRVSGSVVEGGKALAGATVTLYWQQLRARVQLATGQSAVSGEYSLTYTPPENQPGKILVVVEAKTDSGANPVDSGIVAIAPALTINLDFQPDGSEYTGLLLAITPLLGALHVSELVQTDQNQDITYISKQSSVPVTQIMQVVTASLLEAANGSPAPVIPAPVFFAFLRLNVPSALPPDLLTASQNFKAIGPMVSNIASLIFTVAAEIQQQTLETAIARKVIAPSFSAQLPTILQQFEARRYTSALNRPYGSGETPLGQLLALSVLPAAELPAFAKALVTNTQPMSSFWQTLSDGKHGFTPAEAASAELVIELGSFVLNQLPVVKTLLARFQSGATKTVADLAALAQKDWEAILTQSGAGAVPADIAASGTTTAAQLFAAQIYGRVTAAYPTSALASRISQGSMVPDAQRAPLTAFFTANSELDLVTTNLDAYLANKGATAFTGIAATDQAAVIANVRRFQRVLQIAANVDTAQTLLDLGLDSSSRIVMLGERQFVARTAAAGIAAAESEAVFANAEHLYATALSLLTQNHSGFRNVWPAAMGDTSALQSAAGQAVKTNPTLQTLFGPQDFCAVDPATSVLSPAAYLTDLLLWLRNRDPAAAYTTLRTRRPDIGKILLNADNTFTELPYIDLVNELLEDAVAPPKTPVSKQTSLSADELRAAPQYVNAEAYAVLAAASFPLSLPYDASLDLLRTSLHESGVALWKLRQALEPLDGPVAAVQAASVAAERFQINGRELQLITVKDSVPLTTAWGTADPVKDLVSVSLFLQQAGIAYEQLLELLEATWLWNGAAATVLTGVADNCDTTEQTLAPLDEDRLDRMHRFLRLWRRTGWKIWELNLVLETAGIGAGALDAAALVALFAFQQILDTTKFSILRAVTFFRNIDTGAHRQPDGSKTVSQYAQLFQNPALTQDSALSLAATTATTPTAKLADHLGSIGAALQISAGDAASLLAVLPSGDLTLANLSALFRAVTLATASDLSIANLLGLLAIETKTLAQVFASPAETLAFIQSAKAIQKSGFTIPQLTYVLSTSATPAGLTEVQITTALTSVQTAIQAVHGAIFSSTNPPVTVKPPVTVLQTELAQLPAFSDATLLADTIAIVEGTFSGTPAQAAAVGTAVATFMTPAAAAAALYLPLHAAANDPVATLAEAGTRAMAILVPLAVSLTQTQVIASVASSMKLSSDVAALLLGQLHPPGATETLLASFTDAGLIAPGSSPYTSALTPENFPNQFNGLRLLDKIAAVVNGLSLLVADLSWLLANGATYGGLDLTQLPVLPTQPAIATAALSQTVLVVQLNRTFTAVANSTATPPPPIQSLFALITAAGAGGSLGTADLIQARLADITGWSLPDIASLTKAIGVTVGPPNDYLNPSTYSRLRSLLGMAKSTGGTGVQLVAWAGPAPDDAAASSAQQALKSRYTNAAWLEIAPNMMNPMRERRNAALISWLLAQKTDKGVPVWGADADDLFDRFLIDVQMSCCELTSRIVQAYCAIQLFVQRCQMNLEPGLTLDPDNKDDGWLQWEWMQRFQLWVANRKIFLYPENWLIATSRPDSSEQFQTLAQAVHQQEMVSSNLEDVVLAYIGALDGIAHLQVTGVCTSGSTRHVVARTASDPPTYYFRSLVDEIWTAWQQIPLNIKAHQVTPEVYGGNLYLFWPQIAMASEPQQTTPAIKTTDQPAGSPPAAKHVEITLGFSVQRNGNWSAMQVSPGTLYDAPLLDPAAVSHSIAVESLYTLKTVMSGSWLFLDVFRLGGGYFGEGGAADSAPSPFTLAIPMEEPVAYHIGRAIFDGRFNEMQQRNLHAFFGELNRVTLARGWREINPGWREVSMFEYAQTAYGPAAQLLVPLSAPVPSLGGEPGLEPRAGALSTVGRGSNGPSTIPLTFTSLGSLEEYVGPLLATAHVPFRVVGPNAAYFFSPEDHFVYADKQRSYFVRPRVEAEKAKHFRIVYEFSRFYHPYTRMFWHALSSGGFPALYARAVQLAPDTVDKSKADVFSFNQTYRPVAGRTVWGEDDEIVDFSADAAFSVYNWELFYHIPLYIAQLLSQNQQFEDARTWFHYIFNPTNPGKDPIPQRYWIPKPLYDLTSAAIQQQNINQLLQQVNEKNRAADAQVTAWRKNPYDPFVIANQRPAAYMKNVFMSYLDNLIAWADNLFSTESREALNEATLLYTLASEILGPKPPAVKPPAAVDQSFDEMLPHLDAFGDALADIENVAPRRVSAGSRGKGQLHAPQTFYFKIPPNDKLLGYWDTLADRLYKLRHCQNLQGGALDLALFDAPIDPGSLVGAGAAGIGALTDVASPLPNYRFATCYAQAMDFCSAVRAYGASLQTALEKSDADQLSVLLATTQQQLLADGDLILDLQVQQAQANIDSLGQTQALAQQKYDFNNSQPFANPAEYTSAALNAAAGTLKIISAATTLVAAAAAPVPNANLGAAGVGASPTATVSEGGAQVSKASHMAGIHLSTVADMTTILATIANTTGQWLHRKDAADEAATEAQIQVQQAQIQIAGAKLALQIAQQNQQNHQTSIDNLQQQIDLLQNRFSNKDLYDWMAGQLAATYFQSYRLAYAMAKRAERCYRYELGLLDSSFISFGYWDSLRKGLLSGEALNHDLRRMQASYIDSNVRRFEISRIISLSVIDPVALFTLLKTGQCDVDLPETLFDGDYPGHYQRRITRVSVTVVYPNPGKNDNVKCTLTLTKNSVRLTNDLNRQYTRATGSDPRFTDSFGAVQSIVTGNAQDDPGLFINTISGNIADQRYLPFEGAGCISSWHLELPAATNDIDVTTVGDVLLHFYYTALDGGVQFKKAAQAALPAPTGGWKLFSAQNDFGAGSAAFAPTPAQGPVATPWQVFTTLATPPVDQELVLKVAASKFPNWTRGKTITITSLTVYVLSTEGGSFVLQPQPPLQPTPPPALSNVTLDPVPGYPSVATGTVTLPAGTIPGSWTFKLRQSTASDFQSLKSTQLGDVLLLVNYTAS